MSELFNNEERRMEMALLKIDYFSKCLMRTITINAIVPVDKIMFSGMPKREKKPFKTLYLLHGIFGNYTDWVAGTRIKAWAQDRDLVVIMPSGENKFYVDNKASGEYYGELIGKELVEITRNMLPLSHKREDTFIAGLSMGGYGAIRNGLKYHETFGYIAGLSSAFYIEKILKSDNSSNVPTDRRSYFESVFGDLNQLVGSDMDYKALILQLKGKNVDIPKIYMACGTDDFLINENRDYRDFLLDNGVSVTYEEGPGAHEWIFWDTYIKKVLDWLPLEEAQMGISSGNVK